VKLVRYTLLGMLDERRGVLGDGELEEGATGRLEVFEGRLGRGGRLGPVVLTDGELLLGPGGMGVAMSGALKDGGLGGIRPGLQVLKVCATPELSLRCEM
jgi:hypothetical protein